MDLQPPVELKQNEYSGANEPSSPSSYSSETIMNRNNNELTPVSSNNSGSLTPKGHLRTSSPTAKRSSRKSRSANDSTDYASSDSNVSYLKNRRRKSKHTFSSKQFKIFRNLLILEQNLRMQYSEQQSLRTKFLMFYFTLIILSSIIFLKLYFTSNHETLPGVENGAKPWNLFLKFFLVFQIITLILFHISGEYKRTIIMPRKFLYLTNKSLRQLNIRLIKLPKSIFDQLLDVFKICFKIVINVLIWFVEQGLPFNKVFVDKNFCYIKSFLKILKILKLRLVLLHLNSNYDQISLNSTFNIKLSLNSRVFSPNVRENWELFRNEFWLREFTRRTKLIYSISYDTDILAIEKMVLHNELVKHHSPRLSSPSNPILNSSSKSPSRVNNRKLSLPTTPNFNNNQSTLTPLTTQLLKSFESDRPDTTDNARSISRSPSPVNNAILNKSELLKKDRDDRRVRRKSHISSGTTDPNPSSTSDLLEPFTSASSDNYDEEVVEIDDEKRNTFDDETFDKIQDQIKKIGSSSKARRRRYS